MLIELLLESNESKEIWYKDKRGLWHKYKWIKGKDSIYKEWLVSEGETNCFSNLLKTVWMIIALAMRIALQS